MNLADLRETYRLGQLDAADLAPNPIDQFMAWFAAAQAAGVAEPNAMTLATADASGQPSARIVLLKSVANDGFGFFTDYRSQKGRELAQNPRAALCFHWHAMERQVRLAGPVRRLDRAATWEYFRTRPLGSRLGAWASVQSEPVDSRASLEAAMTRVRAEFVGDDVPLPPDWGGFILSPSTVEFWQGRPDRLHDRFRYTQMESGWQCDRLSP